MRARIAASNRVRPRAAATNTARGLEVLMDRVVMTVPTKVARRVTRGPVLTGS